METIKVIVEVEVQKNDETANRSDLQRILEQCLLDTKHEGQFNVKPLKVVDIE